MKHISKEAEFFIPSSQISIIEGSDEFQDIIENVNTAISKMPFTYETENTPLNEKTVYLHYFNPSWDWYIFEKDKGSHDDAESGRQIQAFGMVKTPDGMEGGYINIDELIGINGVELDLHWEPKKWGDVIGSINEKDEVTELEEKIRVIAKSEESPKSTRHLYGEYMELVDKDPSLLKRFLNFIQTVSARYREYITVYSVISSNVNTRFLKNLKTNIYSLIPESYSKISKLKPLAFQADPEDKNLKKIIHPFTGDDSLRLIMNGVLFDSKGIIATDAMSLIFIKKPARDKQGVYCMTSKCWKHVLNEKGEMTEEIKSDTPDLTEIFDKKFPDYKRVIPSNMGFFTRIHTESLRKFCHTIIESRISHNNFIILKMGEDADSFFGFNAEYILASMESMNMLGYDKVDIGYSSPTRGILITPVGNIEKAHKLHTDFTLVMPVMMSEVDMNLNGIVYFDLVNECVVSPGYEDICLNPEIDLKNKLKNAENDIQSLKEKNQELEILEEKRKKDERELIESLAKENQKKEIENKIMKLTAVLLDPEAKFRYGGEVRMKQGGAYVDYAFVKSKPDYEIGEKVVIKDRYSDYTEVTTIKSKENDKGFIIYVVESGAGYLSSEIKPYIGEPAKMAMGGKLPKTYSTDTTVQVIN